MATETTPTPKAATIKELRAACPGATEKFLCNQLEAEATVAAASASWLTALADRNKTLEDELKAVKNKPGVEPAKPNGKKGAKKKDGEEKDDEETEDDDEDDCHDLLDDPIGNFDRLVTAEVKKQVALGRRADRMKAMMQVANQHAELHQAYLVASSGNSRLAKRLVEEKYDMMPTAK